MYCLPVATQGYPSQVSTSPLPSPLPSRDSNDESSGMPPQHKKTKRPATFNAIHESMYGLRVTERDLNTRAVLTVSCRFCVAFGRPRVASTSSARKPLVRIKAFRAPFRVDHFRQHLLSQHSDKWGSTANWNMPTKRPNYFNLINRSPKHCLHTLKKQTTQVFVRL